MEKTILAIQDNFRVIREITLYDYSNMTFTYTYRVQMKIKRFIFGSKWIPIQSWTVNESDDERWCYNEAMELYNTIVNKYRL